jgi:hypothetical protein
MTRDVQEHLLRLAGFEEDEMAKYLPEWRRASEKLRLTEEDIKYAVDKWIPMHFDLSLKGVRMSIGGCLREAIDLMKADEYKKNGYKLVYGTFPSGFQYFNALKLAAPDKIHISVPEAFIAFMLQMLFHKLDPYMVEAEKGGISDACRHCSASKCTYASRRMDVIPTPAVTWVWGFLCDNAPKAHEFIQAYYDPNWKTIYTRVPHDQSMTLDVVEEPEIWEVEYVANEMKESFEAIQKELGIRATDENLAEANEMWRNFSLKLSKLSKLMAADPQPVGGVSTHFLGSPLGTIYNTGLGYMEKALDITIDELEKRVANKEGVLPEGAPKLLAWTAPAGVPWIIKTFEDNGVRYQRLRLGGNRLAPPSYDDPYMATAEQHFRGGNNTGSEFLDLCEEAKVYGADGMVFGFYDFDRWLGGHQRLLFRLFEERVGLPTYYIEGHSWEDRDYSYEALRTRIESICEIVKMRKTAG